jgi:putative addiction module component (TIGR02574 family)
VGTRDVCTSETPDRWPAAEMTETSGGPSPQSSIPVVRHRESSRIALGLLATHSAVDFAPMGQPLSIPPAFDALPVQQQLEYVQALWKRIEERQRDLQSPEWHAEVVEQRLEAHRQDPAAAIPWETVREELHARFGRRR